MKKALRPLVYIAATYFLASCNQQPPSSDKQPAPDNSAQVQALDDKIRQLDEQEKQLQLQNEKDKLAADRAALDAEKQQLEDQRSAPKPESTPRVVSSDDQPKAQVNFQDSDSSLQASEGDSYDVFYSRLKSEGRWYDDDTYGYVFQPDVAERDDWRPYTDGRWAYTDRGYTWVSNEKFGWATYHYGRWARLKGHGWVWVPGKKWAPAWVSWRQSDQDDYVGWAPLPPECDDEQSEKVPVQAWSDNYYGVGPAAYIFLRGADFGRPNYREAVVSPEQNVTILNQTKNITNITYTNNVINNYGPQFDQLNRVNNNQLSRYQINYQAQKTPTAAFATALSGNEVRIVAPPAQLRNVSRVAPPVARQIQNAAVERGWQNVDPAKTQQLKQAIRSQAPPAPKTLPAQPVVPPKATIVAAPPRQGPPPNGQPEKSQAANSGQGQRAQIEAEKARLEQQKQALVKGQAVPQATPAGQPPPNQAAAKSASTPTAVPPPKAALPPGAASAAEKQRLEIETQKQALEQQKAVIQGGKQSQTAPSPLPVRSPVTQTAPQPDAPKAEAARQQQEQAQKAQQATQQQRADAAKAAAARQQQDQAQQGAQQQQADAAKAAAAARQQQEQAQKAAQQQQADAAKAAAARQQQEQAQRAAQQQQADAAKAAAARQQQEQAQRAAQQQQADAAKAATARQQQEAANPQREQAQPPPDEKKRQEEHKNGEKRPTPNP
jgi:hypothetical protein